MVAETLSRVGLIHYGICVPTNLSENFTQLPSDHLGHSTWVENHKLFQDYRFCLVLENKLQAGYITEKILMAFLGGCIPIWYGTTEIFEIFNRQAFLYLNGTASAAIEVLVRRVEELERDPGAYSAMIQQPILADGNITLQKYFSFEDAIGQGVLKHEIRVKMGLEDNEYNQL
jgi:hypothetical protein